MNKSNYHSLKTFYICEGISVNFVLIFLNGVSNKTTLVYVAKYSKLHAVCWIQPNSTEHNYQFTFRNIKI